MRKIPFTKMSGSGNDFILIDNRRKIVREDILKDFVSRICRHRLSVGGDGVILIEPASKPPARQGRGRNRGASANFRWRLFNADGSEAEFSGNGGRCAARFACLQKIAGRKLAFETLAGLVKAEVKKEHVKIQFPEVKNLRLNLSIPIQRAEASERGRLHPAPPVEGATQAPVIDGQALQGHFLNTGVPHVVHYLDDVDLAEVVGLGRKIRHHTLFQPAGTNVNFVMILDPHTIRLRTYERGVEDETLACGTGSVAAALITGALGKGQSPITVIQRSGKSLLVYFRWDGMAFSEVFLEGDAIVVYEGEMWEEAWK